MLAGKWFVTPHAARRFARHVLGWRGEDDELLPEALYRRALSEIISESEGARFLRTLPPDHPGGPAELWRGPRPRRLRYIVGTGRGDKPAVITILAQHDAPRPGP